MTLPRQSEASPPARRSGRADVISGLVVTGGGLILLVSAIGIADPVRPAPGIGPATLPTTLSVLLVLSGLVLAWFGLRRRSVTDVESDVTRYGDAEAAGEPAPAEQPPVRWRRLGVVIALFIGYALVFIPLGYLVSTALYLGAMVTVIDAERWRRNLTFAVVFAVVVYYGFTELLNVQLPAGVLG